MSTTEPKGLFGRIRAGLRKTRETLSSGLGNLLQGRREIDDALLEELETRLLVADVGIRTTTELLDELRDRVARHALADADALFAALRDLLVARLEAVEAPLDVRSAERPFVVLVVGVNGAGKTTTIGKLAQRLGADGQRVMLAAGDTYRAAAVEQLKTWGERLDVPVIDQGQHADSAAVIHDAMVAADARDYDVLLADTAGRLQTRTPLMDELRKVGRVISRLDPAKPDEVLMVLDAGTGQNALSQVRQFREAVDVSGLVVTKLDGTAKGGIVFALAAEFSLPIRFIGVGETAEDLQPFSARAFVDALLERPASEPAASA